jgi:hypothetical protein
MMQHIYYLSVASLLHSGTKHLQVMGDGKGAAVLSALFC